MAVNMATQTDFSGETGPRGARIVPPPSAPAPDTIAKFFPQLEIIECLGRGGMGVVYKARQPRLNRLVALKILAPEREKDPAFAGRFEKEAQALARLNHPNIVTVHDFGETGGMYYLLMEFVDGVTLRHLLGSSRISPREALAIVPQICDALQYAHDHGIVHRDIKPENILLDRAGRVKVADFGLAKLVGGSGTGVSPVGHEQTATIAGETPAPLSSATTEAGHILGTPQYMAPEQVTHPQDVDHRADIYSLGVVFYQMLTGELPGRRLEPPSSRMRGMVIDVRLDEVVLRALEKEPDRRYQQASVLKTEVETIATTPPTAMAGAVALPATPAAQQEGEPATLTRGLPTPPLIRAARIAAVTFLSVFLLSAVITFLLPKRYLGMTRIDVSNEKSAAAKSDAELDWSLRDVRPLIGSSMVLSQVASNLDLKHPWEMQYGRQMGEAEIQDLLRSSLEIRRLPGTSLFEIRFYGNSPDEAADIANMIAKAFCSIRTGKNSAIVELAMPWPRPVKPNVPLNLTIGGIVGAVIGLLAGGLFLLAKFLKRLAQEPFDDSQRSSAVTPANAKGQRLFRDWKIATVVAGFVLSVALVVVGLIPRLIVGRQTGIAEVRYRVFEADSALVDRLIPVEKRQNGVSTSVRSDMAESQVTAVSTNGIFAKTDSQLAQVDPDTLARLLRGMDTKPGLLVDRTREVPLSPSSVAVGWSYAKAGRDFTAAGGGGGSLRVRRDGRNLQVRIECQINHRANNNPGSSPVLSKILYEGNAPPTGALAFLVPFQRKDGSARYLVIAFEIADGQMAQAQWGDRGKGFQRTSESETQASSGPGTSSLPGATNFQTAPVTRGDLSQVITATGTLNPLPNDSAKWQINTSVYEADIVPVTVGQKAGFTIDAFPSRRFTGRVVQVGNAPVKVENMVTYDTRIEVSDAEPKFKPGMTAYVSIIVAHREGVLKIPNAAFRFRLPETSSVAHRANPARPNERTVCVKRGEEGSEPVPVIIKTGINDGSSTEVTEGLREGDRVVIGMTSPQPAAQQTTTATPGSALWQPGREQSVGRAPLSFSPVIERVLNDPDDDAHGNFIIFESGKPIDMPVPWNKNAVSESLLSALNALGHGVDALSDASGDSLNVFKSVTVPVDNTEFDTITPAALATNSVLNGQEPGDKTITTTHPPSTFLFKTYAGHRGSRGILQITGFTENPRGVKIRYKLVQNGKEPVGSK